MATEWRFLHRNDKNLLRAATDALASDFPNPERLGCPMSTVLEAVAKRRMDSSEVIDVVDHIATCTPCFGVYTVYRKKHCSRYYWKLSIAGVAFLATSAAAWYFGHALLPRPMYKQAQISEAAPLMAVLDFHDVTTERSARVQAPESRVIPHLPRTLLNLRILLPLGMEDGQYSIEFRQTGGQPAAQMTGAATWDGKTETLMASIDLRAIQPGPYILAVRKGTDSWRRYSIFVD